MGGAGISDGDELIVNRALEPRDGSVVVAVLDGALTVKRLRITQGGVVLQAENPEYPDIRFLERGSPDGPHLAAIATDRRSLGNGQTTASKILALKRPHLVPIYGSVIAKQVGMRDSGGQWLSRWEVSCTVADYS